MANLIFRDLPMSRELDHKLMAAVRGGNNGGGPASASVPTTSTDLSTLTTSTGLSALTTSVGGIAGTTGAVDAAALDFFFKLDAAANGKFDELFDPDLFR